jgi:tRNA A-37 threonylcarbamoyl transferase component Bud32
MASTRIEQAQDGMPDIPGYRLLRILGHGGMSTVYLAQQLSLGREVAIKVMRQEVLTDETGRRRFENEARTIARLDHPHIVHIHEVGRTPEGQPYHVMPVFPRGHLGKRNLTRDESRIREILEALLSALAYAHSRGIVHRDVKAENVLFDEAERPMLTDFGIALRRGYGSRVTTAGVAVGSTAYMAPEQARGTDVDLRADLYSLGVLAWEMLTGSLPYKAEDGLSMALKHVQDPIPRLPPHLAQWQRFFDRALAKSPGERFADAQDMLTALRRVPHAKKQPLRTAIARVRSRTGPKQLAIAAVVVAAVVGGVALLVQLDRRQTERALARYVPTAAGTALPATPDLDPTLGAPLPDPTQSMLRAAPESAAQRFIVDAQRQLQQGRLIAPAGDNAYDSVMTAWRTDGSHVGLPPVSNRVFAALAGEAEQRLRRNEYDAVRDLLSRMTRLAEQEPARAAARMGDVRKRLAATLSAQMTQAEIRYDRAAAQRVVASARSVGLGSAQVAALQARAGKVAQPGDRIADAIGDMTLVQSSGKLVAVSRSSVSREDYAEFARATGRQPSLCREKASLLRVLAPRTWEQPGFEQPASGAVVCVSWQDAEAFARWQSQRGKYRYRLPTAAEAQGAARSDSGKAVSEWLTDCAGGSCARRMAAGRSWRGTGGGRPLDPARGYDDVGFRLVREM